jgi:hypothetical protein
MLSEAIRSHRSPSAAISGTHEPSALRREAISMQSACNPHAISGTHLLEPSALRMLALMATVTRLPAATALR